MTESKPQYRKLAPSVLAIHPKHLARRLREADRELPRAEAHLARLESSEARAGYPTQRGYNVALSGARSAVFGWRGKLKIVRAVVDGDLVPVDDVNAGTLAYLTRAEYVDAFGEQPPDLRTPVSERISTLNAADAKRAATLAAHRGDPAVAGSVRSEAKTRAARQNGAATRFTPKHETPEAADAAHRASKRESARRRRAGNAETPVKRGRPRKAE